MLAVAEAGGDDYEDADEEWIVYTAPGDLMAVVKELEAVSYTHLDVYKRQVELYRR